MELVIHAGIHRTGTSSLQDFLTANRERLLERGILYPGEGKNHQPLAWALKRGDAGPQGVKKLIESTTTDCKTAVLSAEDFCVHQDLSWLSTISAEIPTKVVFYLRRQDHWIMSWYNQHVKWPFDRWKSRMNPEEFLKHIEEFYWIDFANLLERWSKAVGRDSVRVSTVEKGQVEDVTRDFVEHLGVPFDDLPISPKRENNSMPVHLLDVARHLGLHQLPPRKRIRLIGALRNTLPAPPDLPNTVYSPLQRRTILDRFAKSNTKAARLFLGRDKLFLEPEPKDDEPFYSPPELSHDEWMAEWIKPVIARLVTPVKAKGPQA